jgi:MoaA/NifB/PqqE/SkfB family radical SAM enzyme
VSGRATLELASTCSNRCVFCGRAELAVHADGDLERTLVALRPEVAAVSFVGAEPARSPDLERALAIAQRLEFEAIGLQSNGSGLSGRLRELRGLGLTDLHLSLHGPSARAHDYHTGAAGSFATLAAVASEAARSAVRLVVTTVLTRSNYRELDAIAAWLAAHRVEAWSIAVARTAGHARTGFDRLTPRLSLALPFALRALELARRHRITAMMHDAPLCLLGPHRVHGRRYAPRAFAPRCEGCAARAVCAGVDSRYLERFGDGELRPLESIETELADPREQPFVGPGPLSL